MDFVDSGALLGDMTFQWQEHPFCSLGDSMENPPDHSYLMDSMLMDYLELPEITAMVSDQPSATFPATAPSIVKGSSSASLWPCESAPPPRVSDIVEVAEASGNMVKLPLVVQKGDSFDGRVVEASELNSPQFAACAPFTPPAVKPSRSKGSKREPRSKATAPVKSHAKQQVDADEPVKDSRPMSHAEHIRRERQRREDMSAKYQVLESLLPPAPKRERAVVVEDATRLVRALQQKKVQLLKRRADLKIVEASYQHPQPWSAIMPGASEVHASSGSGYITAAAECNGHKPDSSISSSEGLDGTARNAISVHAGMEDIVLEMVWNRPPPHFESSLLDAVENLGSEVTRCNIVRVTSGFAQCFITCSKPQILSQLNLEIQAMTSEILIMGAVKELLARS